MANYGELIDDNVYDSKAVNKQLHPFYDLFNDYFGNPRLSLYKITPENHIIYGAKIKSNFLKQKRYLFVLISKTSNSAPVQHLHLSEIPWLCLQTRVLDEDIPLPQFSYSHEAPRSSPFIKLAKKEPTKYTYTCDLFPSARIVLLIPETQMKPYNETGTLALALETFQCLIYK